MISLLTKEEADFLVNRPSGEKKILTKGDNNPVDDRGLYPKGQLWVREDQVLGKVVA